MRKIIAVAICAGGLAACVPAKDYVMKNPKTGEIKECRADSPGSPFPIIAQTQANKAAESCAEGYEAAGWKKMNR